MPPLLKPTQVAARWSCSPRHVRRLAESGALRGLKVGSLWRFSLEAVEDFEAANTSEPDGSVSSPSNEGRKAEPFPAFELPADYVPRFPALWPGHVPATRAGTRKTASQRN